MKLAFGILASALISSVAMAQTDWSQVYGYSNQGPTIVNTDPEAQYYATKRLEQRVDGLEGRMDKVETEQGVLGARVQRLERHDAYHPGYPHHPGHGHCRFARITSDAMLMNGLHWSSSHSIGTLYSGYVTVEILSGLYRWSNYPYEHALYVRVSHDSYGYMTNSYGYIELSKIPAYACGYRVNK